MSHMQMDMLPKILIKAWINLFIQQFLSIMYQTLFRVREIDQGVFVETERETDH